MTLLQDCKTALAAARSQSDAQKGRSAVWTGEARLYGEEHGCLESHEGAA